ncbi:hypothetical protein V2J09_011366 [Rumex salicifolius]
MDSGKREVRQYTSADQLPSGFRFTPNDHEILSYFLINKVCRQQIALNPILDYNQTSFYSNHPKDLGNNSPPHRHSSISLSNFISNSFSGFVLVGPSSQERATYFFVSEDEAFQNQTTREVGDIGLWRITEPKTQILDRSNRSLSIGSKMGFTFFNLKGKAPKKTHWRMTEYQLPLQIYHQHNEWIVLARISRGTDYGED